MSARVERKLAGSIERKLAGSIERKLAGPIDRKPAGPTERALPEPIELGLAVLCLLAFLVMGVIAARTHTPTVDEFVYLPAGYYHLRTGDLTFDSSNPPLVKMLMAVPLLAMDLELDRDPRWRDNRTGWAPWTFGTRFMETNTTRYLDAFFAGRCVVLLFGVVTGALAWWWARSLMSAPAALVALLLYATTPWVIAHSAIATLDLGVTALIFGGFFALYRFAATRMRAWAVASGVLFGLGIVAKGVTFIVLPLVPVLVAASWGKWDRESLVTLADGLVAMAVAAWVAVLAVYRFSGFPLPGPVLEGIQFQSNASSAGEFPAFLNGAWSQTGWWYYFLTAFLLKTPLPSIVLIAAGIWTIARRRLRGPGDLWMLLPPLWLLYVLSFHFGKNYGIRYLLPVLPFLVMLAGVGAEAWLKDRRAAVALAALLVWQTASTVIATPHHLAWFNALAGSTDHHRRLLLDSNLDWGQDLGRLAAQLAAEGSHQTCLGYFGHVDPAIYGLEYSLPPTAPTPGKCAVSANFLAGYPYAVTYAGPRIQGVRRDAWSWFDRLEPTARIGSSIYLFDVTEADVRRLGK
jgi:hypothetical protein